MIFLDDKSEFNHFIKCNNLEKVKLLYNNKNKLIQNNLIRHAFNTCIINNYLKMIQWLHNKNNTLVKNKYVNYTLNKNISKVTIEMIIWLYDKNKKILNYNLTNCIMKIFILCTHNKINYLSDEIFYNIWKNECYKSILHHYKNRLWNKRKYAIILMYKINCSKNILSCLPYDLSRNIITFL